MSRKSATVILLEKNQSAFRGDWTDRIELTQRAVSRERSNTRRSQRHLKKNALRRHCLAVGTRERTAGGMFNELFTRMQKVEQELHAIHGDQLSGFGCMPERVDHTLLDLTRRRDSAKISTEERVDKDRSESMGSLKQPAVAGRRQAACSTTPFAIEVCSAQ